MVRYLPALLVLFWTTIAVAQTHNTGAGRPRYDIIYTSSEDDVNLFTALGSPAAARQYRVRVVEGVIIGSTGTGTPAMQTTSSFTAGSTFVIALDGPTARIAGAGGNGGQGGEVEVSDVCGGGGGGGAGDSNPGDAGSAHAVCSNGSAGTATAGGAGGSGAAGVINTTVAAVNGGAGGVAFETNFDTSIIGTGDLWGGGGGGGGGGGIGQGSGGAGGNPGAAGSNGTGTGPGSGGAAGNSVTDNGNTVTVGANIDQQGPSP